MSRNVWCWAALVVMFGSALARASESDTRENIDAARTALQEWVKVKANISKERQDWALGHELLLEQIQLAEDEIASYRNRIAEIQANIGQADTERAGLVEEKDALKASSARLGEVIASLESRTIALDRKLPAEAHSGIVMLSQQLPADPNETRLSLSQRFLNELAILDTLNKFNRAIEVVSETRQLPGGGAAEVSTMYVGLGQTYYTGAGATLGGVGRPGPTGWQWEPANDAAKDVSRAIAIWNNEEVAGFVSLPVTVQQGTAHDQ